MSETEEARLEALRGLSEAASEGPWFVAAGGPTDAHRRVPNHITARTNRCKRGHELTPENTAIFKADGCRRCRACIYARQNAKRRAAA